MQISKRLWGRSLSDERDARVIEETEFREDWNKTMSLAGGKTIERSVQAIRGHMTRALLEELKPEIEARKRRVRALHKEKKR